MFLARVTWCFFSVTVIRKAPCETPYQGLCCYHGNKRPKHHCVCHHSCQLVWWCWYCLIKFDFQVKGLLDYRDTLKALMLRYLRKVQRISGEFLAERSPYILCCDWNFSPRVNPLRTNPDKYGEQRVCIYRVGKHETTPSLAALWLGRKKQKFSGTNQKPELLRPFGTGPLRPCPQGLFHSFLTFLRPNFFLARLDFLPPPLTAPGSPRMYVSTIAVKIVKSIKAFSPTLMWNWMYFMLAKE